MNGRTKAAAFAEQELRSEIFHQLSQPLSVLECGLELSLLHDRTAAEFRRRAKILLETAREMHRCLLDLRARDLGPTADEGPSGPLAHEEELTPFQAR